MIFLVFSSIVFISLSPINTTQDDLNSPSFLNGNGTSEDPYLIENVDDLQDMTKDLEADYKIVNEIDASETEEWNDGKGFEPVGEEDTEFNGSLEGNGYDIVDLFINRSNTDGVGLFGAIGLEGEVKNVTLINFEIKGNYFVGSIAGGNEGNIYNTTVSGELIGDEYVGGLSGANKGTLNHEYGIVKGSSASVLPHL